MIGRIGARGLSRKRLVGLAMLLLLGFATDLGAQDLKSGPQKDEALNGSFQPLNVNGPFAGRYHCLVTEFRFKPVVLIFVRGQPDGDNKELKKLLEEVDKVASLQHTETGLSAFVVFLSPHAKSSVTEGKVADAGEATTIIAEAKNREKLVKSLKELAEPFKQLIVTCCPPDSVDKQYLLKDTAEVTVLVYAHQRVSFNHAFGDGKLNQEGIATILQSVEATLAMVKKAGPGK